VATTIQQLRSGVACLAIVAWHFHLVIFNPNQHLFTEHRVLEWPRLRGMAEARTFAGGGRPCGSEEETFETGGGTKAIATQPASTETIGTDNPDR
jgi:hypothetical protein